MKYINLGCQGVYATKDHALSSHLICGKDTTVMIDAGNGSFNKYLQIVETERLDAVILSHLHFDHICDIFVMNYALAYCNEHRPKLYIPKTPSDMNEMVKKGCTKFDIVEYEADSVIVIGSLTFTFTTMTHPIETYAIKCTEGDCSLFYTGDTNYNNEIEKAAYGCGLFIADACLLDRQLTSTSLHLSAAQAGKIAREARVRKLILSHQFPTTRVSEYEEEARRFFAESYAATELKTVEVE